MGIYGGGLDAFQLFSALYLSLCLSHFPASHPPTLLTPITNTAAMQNAAIGRGRDYAMVANGACEQEAGG